MIVKRKGKSIFRIGEAKISVLVQNIVLRKFQPYYIKYNTYIHHPGKNKFQFFLFFFVYFIFVH